MLHVRNLDLLWLFLFFYNTNNRCARKLKTKTEKTILFLAHVIYGFMVSFIMMIQYRVGQKKTFAFWWSVIFFFRTIHMTKLFIMNHHNILHYISRSISSSPPLLVSIILSFQVCFYYILLI